MQGWHATRGLTHLPILTFYFRFDWIYGHCCSLFVMFILGISSKFPLWSWLAVKTSSPFNGLLPQEITLHPLTLDITTPQQVLWNCGREKTRWWCLSLFARFLQNALLRSHMNALTSHPPFCHPVMHHQSVIFSASQELFCVRVIELIFHGVFTFPKTAFVLFFLSSCASVSNLLCFSQCLLGPFRVVVFSQSWAAAQQLIVNTGKGQRSLIHPYLKKNTVFYSI